MKNFRILTLTMVWIFKDRVEELKLTRRRIAIRPYLDHNYSTVSFEQSESKRIRISFPKNRFLHFLVRNIFWLLSFYVTLDAFGSLCGPVDQSRKLKPMRQLLQRGQVIRLNLKKDLTLNILSSLPATWVS